MITEDNVYPKREISLAESPVHLVRIFFKLTICLAPPFLKLLEYFVSEF